MGKREGIVRVARQHCIPVGNRHQTRKLSPNGRKTRERTVRLVRPVQGRKLRLLGVIREKRFCPHREAFGNSNKISQENSRRYLEIPHYRISVSSVWYSYIPLWREGIF